MRTLKIDISPETLALFPLSVNAFTQQICCHAS